MTHMNSSLYMQFMKQCSIIFNFNFKVYIFEIIILKLIVLFMVKESLSCECTCISDISYQIWDH